MRGQLVAFVTATRVEWHGDSDDYTEEHGWVSVDDSTELEESRNYVPALYSEPVEYVQVPGGVELEELTEDRCDEIRDAMDSVPGGPWWDNGDGTYYGQGEVTENDGGSFTYAVHWHVKRLTGRGWVETPVSVSEILPNVLGN